MNKNKRIISIEDVLHPESYKKIRKDQKIKIVEHYYPQSFLAAQMK